MTRDAVSLASSIAKKELSPVEVIRESLECIRRLNHKLNAIVAVDEAAAMAAAQRSERRQMSGSRLGPLDGVPVTVKDNLFVRGFRATWGSRLFEQYEPNIDDLVVARLRAAGAIIVGKTNTPEFALDNETTNLVFGPTLNPWDTSLTPGGSSGGAAVSVAAGMVPLAVGTDSGGSIRQPAGFTGVLGFKPTIGRIPRAYGFPALVSDFQVIGLMARSLSDLVLFASVVAGPDLRDRASLAFANEELEAQSPFAVPTSLSTSSAPRTRMKILSVTEFGGRPIAAPIREAIERAAAAFADAGHLIESATLPFDLEPLFEIWKTLSDAAVARAVTAARAPMSQVGAVVKQAADRGATITASDYLTALEQLAAFRLHVVERWHGFDVILGPTSASMPWPVDPAQPYDEPASAPYVSMFNKLANATGYPAICIPGEPAPSGLPIGLQVVARYGEEARLLSLFDARAA